MFLYNVCLSVRLWKVDGPIKPMDNLSKMVKATDFKFDKVPQDSPNMTLI